MDELLGRTLLEKVHSIVVDCSDFKPKRSPSHQRHPIKSVLGHKEE
jgi:hypothetical protein